MTISEVYEKYPVHRGLQEHMIRVAAVAKQICDNYESLIDRDTVVAACLLHDMGNLIKVKFELEPNLFEPEGVAYWQAAQARMIAEYGSVVHDATIAIIKDVAISEAVLSTLDEASFEEIIKVAMNGSLEAQLLEYADLRVGMTGIISLRGRFEDIRNRYVPQRFTPEEIDEKFKAAKQIETDIFSQITISPEDITDESTESIQAELWSWKIK